MGERALMEINAAVSMRTDSNLPSPTEGKSSKEARCRGEMEVLGFQFALKVRRQ
jgi:hypothetical protein